MTRIYAVTMQKGGVGKTTSAVNMSAYLAEAGLKVLLIDLDPQANATSNFGFDKRQLESSIYDALLDGNSVDRVILNHEASKVDLIPSNTALAGAEVELVSMPSREFRLNETLNRLDGRYDYILIDCPPGLGLLTINALVAARDGVLIPVQCEYLALEGLTQLIETIGLVKKHLNRSLTIRGLIMNMYDRRTRLSHQVVDEVKRHFRGSVFKAIIPRNVRLSEAPSFGMPINLYAPRSSGAMAFKVLTMELLKGDLVKEKER